MKRTEQSDLRIGYGSVCPDSGQERDSCAVIAFEPLSPEGAPVTLIAVARGTRGQVAGIGKTAAETAVNALAETFDAAETADIITPLSDGFVLAAQQIAGLGDVAATCSAVVVADGRLYLASCGDCRVFLLRFGLIQQISVTHTWSHQSVEQGQMTEDQLHAQPIRDFLTRSLGSGQAEADFRLRLRATDDDAQAVANQGTPVRAGDRIIVCSGEAFPTMLFTHDYPNYHLDVFEENADAQAAVDRFIEARGQMGWPAEMTVVVADVG